MGQYTADNTSGPKKAFDLKFAAKHISYPSWAPPPIDMLYDRRLYGRIDSKGRGSYLAMPAVSLTMHDDTNGHYTVDFVTRAFEDFKRDYIESIRNGAPLFYGMSEIRTANAWSSFRTAYTDYQQGVTDYLLSTYIKERQTKIVNFNQFVEVIMDYLADHGQKFPISRTGFITSEHCPSTVSGLIIDIHEYSNLDDSTKMEMFQDPGFKNYAFLLARHGFFIDKNMPSRIIANLGSYPMQEHMNDSNLEWHPGSASNYFERYCLKTHYEDMEAIRDYLYGLYNEFILNNPYMRNVVFCNGRKSEVVQARVAAEEMPRGEITLNYWNTILVRTRISESILKEPFTKREIDDIIKKMRLIMYVHNHEKALNVLNSAILKRSLHNLDFEETQLFLNSENKMIQKKYLRDFAESKTAREAFEAANS